MDSNPLCNRLHAMNNCIKIKCLVLFCGVLLLLTNSAPLMAQVPSTAVGVFYIGPEDVVAEAINLAHPYIVRVDQPELAQVIVLNNAPLSEERLNFYGEQVRNNRLGLVVFCGNMFPKDVADLGALLGISAFGFAQVQSPATLVTEDEIDEVQLAVTWSSAPEIYARTVISNPNILRPLISTETGQPVILRVRGREPSQTLIVGTWFDDPANRSWVDWPYYHYFIYQLIMDAAGRSRSLNYADYPLSPVPQRAGRWGIAVGGIGVIVGTAAIFYFARRSRFLQPQATVNQETQENVKQRGNQLWERAGFHKSLAGLLVLLPLNMLLYFLLIRYRLTTLPEVLSPNLQAFSSWQLVEQWAELIWVLLDAGTGIAAVRYFAAAHPRHPRRAYTFFQFYGWWHLFIGAAQLGIVALFSAVIMPGTRFAHLTYFILFQSVMRFPGFLTIFVLLLRALQRLDFEQYLIFFLTYGTAVFQAAAYLAFKTWGISWSVVNQNQSTLLGLGLGIYAAEWLVFIAGMGLYRWLGLGFAPLSLPRAGSQVGRQLLSFGSRVALGSAAVPLGALIQHRILMSAAPELASSWQTWLIAVQLSWIYILVLHPFYCNMLPALTEAIALDYKTLLRYYLTQGLRYGMWVSVFIAVIFSILGEQIVRIINPGVYPDIASIISVLFILNAFRFLQWLMDALLLAAEHPGLYGILIFTEQMILIGGGAWLAAEYGAPGYLSAFALALFARTVLAWVWMQRLIIRLHIYSWQSVISPLVSGVLLYYGLRVILERIPPAWESGFVLAALPLGFWLYGFISALTGGWDAANLKEFGHAVRLSGIGKPYAWILWRCIRLGARISPLHGRFPVVIAGIAEEQALAITYTRNTP